MKGRTLADQNKGSKGKVNMMGGRMVPNMMDRAGRAMAPMAAPVMADRMGRAMKVGGMSYKKGGSMYRKGGSTCK
jgi:hypothetical protein